MIRRGMDILLSAGALVFAGPLLAVAAIGIAFSSPGPIFYRASRVGRDGRLFTMLKLRTMHCREVVGSSITSADDPRVFRLGKILRSLKIDELPQLWNVLIGDMAIVGPRPEAPDIVERWYTPEYRQTLNVRPGLTSPGSIYYYQHGEQLLEDGQAEDQYGNVLLPAKMRQDIEYLNHSGVWTDIVVICRTAGILAARCLPAREGKPLPQPQDYARPQNSANRSPDSEVSRRAA